jgi:signal peptidase I
MSDDWGSYRSGDEDEEKDDAGPGGDDPGRDDPGGWPQEPGTGSTDWPTPSSPWQPPDYGESRGNWQQSDDPGHRDYGYTRRDELFDDDEPEPYESQHSRDPLARLFPGLPRSVRVTLDWILTIAGAILIVLALKQWVVNPYRIPSSSMEPTLNCAKGPASPGCLGNSSDRVLACRICLDFGHNPKRGDIVVFHTPPAATTDCGEGGTFVKRVIGLPGDTVRDDKHGNILIKAPGSPEFVKLQEPYISTQDRLGDHTHGTWTVPEGSYFMMGDNRGESCDSRTWGSVPRNKLIGIVFFTYWPPDRISFH